MNWVLKKSYRTEPWPEEVLTLAQKITELLIDSSATFQQASDALEAAQDILLEQTRPVRVPACSDGQK